MTKLVKNLIIGGSATTVLAGGGTGIALALSGKKSSHSNNQAVVAVVKNNQSAKVELERIKKEIETASTPEELKKVETELKEWMVQNPGVTHVIEKEVKELINEVVTEESKFETPDTNKRVAIKAAKQLISETITEELASKAAASEKHNVYKEVKETTSNFVSHELDKEAIKAAKQLISETANKELEQKAFETHSKEISSQAHQLFVQAELDRVNSLTEGTKELKEGTKTDFVNGNAVYEAQKAALVDATHAQELLEAQARLDELKRVFALNNGSKYVKDGARQANIKTSIEYEANKEITTEANHAKEVAEALAAKQAAQAELDRVHSLAEGTKESKEGTKTDFANGNAVYEAQKAALVDATHAQELLEAQARLDELKRVFALNNGSKYVKDGARQASIKSSIEYEANKEITTEANHTKEVAEALAAKQAAQAELNRVSALPEGTKDLKEGTKFDFVTSNIEYEIKKQAATDAEYARVLAETQARHADLVNAFNKRESDKDLKQLYSKLVTEEQERIAAQVEQIKRELTKLANDNLAAIQKQTQEARNLYSETTKGEEDKMGEHTRMTELQRQAEIQSKVEEVQKQISSQISTIFGNKPLVIEHSIVEAQKGLNAGTQTFRYGTDLISMFGNAGSTALNKILNSLQVDNVKFGIKTFIEDGKLNILAVAIDNNGHELTTSSQTPVKIDFIEPTRPISATSSAQDMKFALAVALKENQDSHRDIISIAQDLILKLSNSETLNVANGVVAEGDVDAIIKSAITSLESTRRAGLPSKTEEMYPYILNRAIELIDAEIQKGHISYAGYTPIQGVDTHLAADNARVVFRAEALKIMSALNSVRNGY